MFDGLPHYQNQDDVLRVLACGSREEKVLLPLALGRKFPDLNFALSICQQMVQTGDQAQQANACIGLAALAERGAELDIAEIEPLLVAAQKSNTNYAWCIDDAIARINQYSRGQMGEYDQYRQEA